ncbi:aminotransferase class IV [Sinorhizobium medicae]|nr:aminotransferase class IV [Sinorhizobium medicae]
MAASVNSFQIVLDGRKAAPEELNPLVFAGFAHFTAMQVRDGKVRGMDLHLARLRAASVDFFGAALPDESLRSFMRIAIEDGSCEQSLTVTIFSRSGEFTSAGIGSEPAALVRTGPPSKGPIGPLRLAVVNFERPLPTVKHVGEAAKTYYLHQAVRQGFDDAAFVDRRGRLSEATIWNLVYWDGEAVVWPEAAVLAGVTMGVVSRQLKRLGIPQRREEITLENLKHLQGVAVMNSWTPGVPVTTIGQVVLPEAKPFIELLHKAYIAEPALSI